MVKEKLGIFGRLLAKIGKHFYWWRARKMNGILMSLDFLECMRIIIEYHDNNLPAALATFKELGHSAGQSVVYEFLDAGKRIFSKSLEDYPTILAAAYYISGQKEAAKSIDTAPAELTDYRELSGTYGSALRDRALMLYLCMKMDDRKTATLILKNVMDSFTNRSWYSTQETAMALLGISSYYRDMPGTGGMVKFKVKIAGEKDQTVELSNYQSTMDVSAMWNKKINISFFDF